MLEPKLPAEAPEVLRLAERRLEAGRRFGKSLLVSILQCYYDVDYAARFDELFGGLRIVAKPTAARPADWSIGRMRFRIPNLTVATILKEIRDAARRQCGLEVLP